MAALDIKTHPVFNLEEQLALFDGSKGQSKAAKWMADIAEFSPAWAGSRLTS